MLAPGINDVRDFAELTSGKDMITGANLKLWERSLCAIGLIGGSGSGARKLYGDGCDHIRSKWYKWMDDPVKWRGVKNKEALLQGLMVHEIESVKMKKVGLRVNRVFPKEAVKPGVKTRMRPDAVDMGKKTVYELKPRTASGQRAMKEKIGPGGTYTKVMRSDWRREPLWYEN